MVFDLDIVNLINLVLCISIVILEDLSTRKRTHGGIDYRSCLRTFWHFPSLYSVGAGSTMGSRCTISARTAGYILVIVALYLFLNRGIDKGEE